MLPRRIWNCRGCKKQFSVKVGTIFEDSPLTLLKWLPAVWLIVNAKNGISSCELARSLGVTQKTAWFMLHRIRLAMQEGSINKMKGQVEVDETFIGAKARNLHADKRRKLVKTGRSLGTPVQGLLERQGEQCSRVVAMTVKERSQTTLQDNVRKHAEKGSNLLTDEWSGYFGLHGDYVHQVINHAESYAEGHVHTNGLENFWSLLKRGLKGTYVNVEPFHLFRYLDEQVFRFNARKLTDKMRFLATIGKFAGRRLTYAKLTDADGSDSLPISPSPAGAW